MTSALSFDSIDDVAEYCKLHQKKFVVLNDDVIDCEGFKHPGGDLFITDAIGTDISHDFFTTTDHSQFAVGLAKERKVGKVLTKNG